LDNVLSLREKHGLRAEDVAEMECRVHPAKVAYLDRPRADTPLAAKFSIQFCAATALLHGKVGVTEFADGNIARPETRALMKKIRIAGDPALGSFASEVRVRNVDGRAHASSVPEPRGGARFPLSKAALRGKFVDCAMVTMSAARAQEAAAALTTFEHRNDIPALLRLLVSDEPGRAPACRESL
jgi:2-methylcitrate dehydratase PrpD